MVELYSFHYDEINKDNFPFINNSKISSYLRDSNKMATLSRNPNLCKHSSCPQVITGVVNEVLAGAVVFMPSRMRIEDEISSDVLSGAGLETLEEYRDTDIGAHLMRYPITNTEYEHILYAGISPVAYKIYKAMRFNLIDTPYLLNIRSSKLIWKLVLGNGSISKVISAVCDVFFKPLTRIITKCALYPDDSFVVEKKDTVPVWVDDIILQDKHKYSELHDHKWIQWSIDNSFYLNRKNKQSFYAITKGGKPFGFFCTNEKVKSMKGGKVEGILLGNIYEWGAFNENILSEYEIVKLALRTFSNDVDIIAYTSDNNDVIAKLRKRLFITYGNVHIVYKNTKKRCKDAGDIKNWRVRLGYADTPFYF